MTEEANHLLVDKTDGVMTLTMNRPEVGNALSPQMLVKMAEAWYAFRDTRDLRRAGFDQQGEQSANGDHRNAKDGQQPPSGNQPAQVGGGSFVLPESEHDE